MGGPRRRSGCNISAGPTFPPLPTSMDQYKIKTILVQAQHDPLGYLDRPLQEKTQIEEDFLDFHSSVELDSSVPWFWMSPPSQWCGPAVLCRDGGPDSWERFVARVTLTSLSSSTAQLHQPPGRNKLQLFLDRKGAVFFKISSLPAVCSAEFLSAESQLPGSGWKVLGVTTEPPWLKNPPIGICHWRKELRGLFEQLNFGMQTTAILLT